MLIRLTEVNYGLWDDKEYMTITKKKITQMIRRSLAPFPSLEDRARLVYYRIKNMKHLLPANELSDVNTSQEDCRLSEVRQLFVDVSQLVRYDRQAGIERVVRSVLAELMKNPPSGMIVKPVYANDCGVFCYANHFARTFCAGSELDEVDLPVNVYADDIFYCPDFYLTFPFESLKRLKVSGLKCVFTVYDIIPIRSPHFFWTADVLAHFKWFRGVLSVADGIVTDSQTVANDLYGWLMENHNYRASNLPIGYFHLGSTTSVAKSLDKVDVTTFDLLEKIRQRPTFLMVGTLEPRKGHAQVIEAIELLWKSGADVNLVIVGKEGWRTYALAARLAKHTELNHRLFWLKNASDESLAALYAGSTALIAASYNEGFGLPLIEAAQHELPIIARDIPIFREVAGKHAFYFNGLDAVALRDAISNWQLLHEMGEAPRSVLISPLTWEESVMRLTECIIENKWYLNWYPA